MLVDIFWLVVGGGGYILTDGWWCWMVVGGGIAYFDPFNCSFNFVIIETHSYDVVHDEKAMRALIIQ